jgi:hypothetical protein
MISTLLNLRFTVHPSVIVMYKEFSIRMQAGETWGFVWSNALAAENYPVQ